MVELSSHCGKVWYVALLSHFSNELNCPKLHRLIFRLVWIHISCGVTIIDGWSQCWCVSVWPLPNVLGTGTGKRKADGTIGLRCHRPTGHHPVQGACISRSRSHHKSLPHKLTVLCHPQSVFRVHFGFVAVTSARLSGFLLHNVHFLPDKQHQTWQPSVNMKQASSSPAKGGLLSTQLWVPGLCHV